jgi:rhodanese-related sulfurtransferase
VAGALKIPVGELRSRLGELSPESDLRVYCMVGQRGYMATRLLVQHGFAVRNISGGWALAPYLQPSLSAA